MKSLLISIGGVVQLSKKKPEVGLYINGKKRYIKRSYLRIANLTVRPLIWRWDLSRRNHQIKVGPFWYYL